jgi:hypothetical protein
VVHFYTAIYTTIRQIEREREEKRAHTEKQFAEDRMKEKALQSFLERLEELLVNHNLYDSKQGDVIRSIARTRTLTTLRQIDPKRKSILLHFLIDSGLVSIKNGSVIIDLSGADLEQVELHDANLEGARLSKANLKGAKLDYCNLKGAILIDANLQSSSLTYCNLEGARLSPDVYLARAQITNLKDANLSSTILKGTYLHDVSFNENTILPDGTNWSTNVDLHRFTEEA